MANKKPKKLKKKVMAELLKDCTHFYGSSPRQFSNEFNLVAHDDNSDIVEYGSNFAEYMKMKEFILKEFIDLWFESNKYYKKKKDKYKHEKSKVKRQHYWIGGCYIITNGTSTCYTAQN